MSKLIVLVIALLCCSEALGRVENPLVFIGELVKGSTLGAPLITDLNGKVASGLLVTSVSATSSTTTTSTTDILINTMTITPAAGTYMVWFHTTLQSNSNNANIFASIYSGGVQSSGSELGATPQFQGGLTPSLNVLVPITLVNTVIVNGAQAIEARWRITAGTATAGTRTLQILRVL